MPMSPETAERFANEQRAYWQQREQMVSLYDGMWVAMVGGQVVAVGDRMNRVAAEAFRRTRSRVMFVTLVGEEDVEFRVRQVTTGYHDARRSGVRVGTGILGARVVKQRTAREKLSI